MHARPTFVRTYDTNIRVSGRRDAHGPGQGMEHHDLGANQAQKTTGHDKLKRSLLEAPASKSKEQRKLLKIQLNLELCFF